MLVWKPVDGIFLRGAAVGDEARDDLREVAAHHIFDVERGRV